MTNLKRLGRYTVFEENVHDLYNYSSNRHPLQTLHGWTCMVTVTSRVSQNTQKHDKHDVDPQRTLSQSVKSHAVNNLTQQW